MRHATALAAPAQPREFIAFNALYVDRLQRWAVLHEKLNPVSRTNVAPLPARRRNLRCMLFPIRCRTPAP